MLWRGLSLRTVASLSLLMVGASALVPGPTAAAQEPPVGDGPLPPAVADLYVVSFAGGAAGAEEVAEGIEGAGGEVVDVLEPLDVALVAATGDEVAGIRAVDGVEAAVRNHSVGTAEPGMPRHAEELPVLDELVSPPADPAGPPGPRSAPGSASGAEGLAATAQQPAGEPLAPHQWGMAMIGATADGAQAEATGRGVDVGIMDTGVDGSHPDLAPNFDASRSRSFVLPEGSPPCPDFSCAPPDIDGGGHGTHVAGVVAAARNGLGIAGVAPEATLVNLRAGNDAGYFFVYEVSSALVAAADMGLDVVNMSFYTDPWLYNCASEEDYIAGTVTPEEIEEQALVRRLMLDALDYADQRGVTLVAAAGNQHTDMGASQREDATSPDFPPGSGRYRVVTDDCLDLPAEGPTVLTVASVGPSGTKADYSNYGLDSIDLAAPGGWLRDGAGTPGFQSPENLILSSYPLAVAQQEGVADPDGRPTDESAVQDCQQAGCGFYRYMQGTSMAAPFVAGVAALVVERHGEGSADEGYSLAPDQVAEILTATAADQPCPAGGVADYLAAGRPPSWSAPCEGDATYNSLYGHGIVSAVDAVRAARPVS